MSALVAAAVAAYPTVIEVASQVGKTIAVNTAKSQYDSFNHGNSLPEYTQSARLAPVVLIDKKVLVIDPKLTTALLQTILSLYTGYYLMAVNMSMHVGDVKVMDVLDKFSTGRNDALGAGVSMFADAFISTYSKEEIDDGLSNLPIYGLEAGYGFNTHKENIKAIRNKGKLVDHEKVKEEEKVNKEKSELQDTKRYDHSKDIQTINDESNLAVGKIINVTINNGKSFVTIPVMATLIPKSMDPAEFLDSARFSNTDGSAKGRYHQWRAGEIRFIKDYLLCLDLIEADKKALLADKTGSLLSIRNKHTAAAAKGAVTGKFSPNEISAMVIISKQTASDLEYILKGSLKQISIRQQYFNSNSTMMLVVVDVTMERFTIYQRGIADYADYTLEDIKGNAKKANGISITDVLKAYSQGSMPNI